MLDRNPFIFRVTDLKQYVYCSRVLYYHIVLPAVRPVTYKMEAGIAAHSKAVASEKRRTLRSYGLKEGVRHFDVALYSATMGLSGELDMLVESDEELIPVDYKNTSRQGSHFRLQLMAYGRLLEELWPGDGRPVKRGFLYLIPERQAIQVRFTPGLRRQFKATMEEVARIARDQHVPPATIRPRRCVDCEFRRFCNDVL